MSARTMPSHSAERKKHEILSKKLPYNIKDTDLFTHYSSIVFRTLDIRQGWGLERDQVVSAIISIWGLKDNRIM